MINEHIESVDELCALVNYYEDALHDLKTPVSIILLQLQSMSAAVQELAGEPRGRLAELDENVSFCLRNCDYIVKILKETAENARIMQGKLEPRLESCDMVSLASANVSNLTLLSARKHVSLTLTTDAEELIMATDKWLMDRVFQNLLTNAMKFTPRDGAVHVTLSSREKTLTLVVSDTGKGFSNDVLPKAFKRRVTEGGGHSGSGLGLAIVGKIIASLGGSVTAGNGAQGGAVVTVTLPITTGIPKGEAAKAYDEDEAKGDMEQISLLIP